MKCHEHKKILWNCGLVFTYLYPQVENLIFQRLLVIMLAKKEIVFHCSKIVLLDRKDKVLISEFFKKLSAAL